MFKRKAWVANPADPTAVTQWSFKRKFDWLPFNHRWFSITLLQSWGVESNVDLFGWKFWGYDQFWAVWLFVTLERRWENREHYYDTDPMGRLSDYE